MEKNEKWFKSIFDQPLLLNNTQPEEPANKKIKLEETNEKKSELQNNNVINNNNYKNFNYMEYFAPESVNDLAVNTKKIAELDTWFSDIESNKKTKILLITGPSGSAKTETLKLLAKKYNYDLTEWINPPDLDDFDDKITYVNQTDQFTQFLFSTSRYSSLFAKSTKRLIFVKDFPNIFLKDSGAFHEVLENFLIYGKSPLIFNVSDTKCKQLDLSYKLFGDSVKEKFHIAHINFNAVSVTLMKKALNRLSNLMTKPEAFMFYNSPTEEIVDNILIESSGDVRSATINLHYSCLKCKTEDSKCKAILQKNKKKKTKRQAKTVAAAVNPESISIMHALGRVFHPKYKEQSTIDQYKQFIHSPEEIADYFINSRSTNYILLLHTNYLLHYSDIDNVVNAADICSSSDVIMKSWQEDLSLELGLTTAVRGLMVFNDKNEAKRWQPIRGHKKQNEYILEDELCKLGMDKCISKRTLATDMRTYVKIINSKNV